MSFPSLEFGLFFLVTFVVIWRIQDNEWRKILLLGASWFFYGQWDWAFVALLIASSLGNWLVARLVQATDGPIKRVVLVAGVVLNVGILAYFKYCGFFLEQLGVALTAIGWGRDLPIVDAVLPLGVSFFTFQGISYIVDVYRRKIPAAAALDVMLLMSFFPHLVSGPIVRGADLLPQFGKLPRLDREIAAQALLQIVWGLFKKTIIAALLSTTLVDPVFNDPQAHSGAETLTAIYAYAVQIYCDFSAYSDMAIGIAALLGYHFNKNFDQPYRAASLGEFWRRWHISLSSWLRDYVYVPLGGNRKGALRTYFNLLATMLLGGIWHGASIKFLIWGGLHGGVLSLERTAQSTREGGKASLGRLVGTLATFHVVCLGWVLFRSDSFATAEAVLQRLGDWSGLAPLVTPVVVALIAFGLSMHFTPADLLERLSLRASRLSALAMGAFVAGLVMTVDAMQPDGVAPFIYFQF